MKPEKKEKKARGPSTKFGYQAVFEALVAGRIDELFRDQKKKVEAQELMTAVKNLKMVKPEWQIPESVSQKLVGVKSRGARVPGQSSEIVIQNRNKQGPKSPTAVVSVGFLGLEAKSPGAKVMVEYLDSPRRIVLKLKSAG